MINDKVSDYIFHTTFDSSITDITDQIFGEDINWQDHTWTDNYDKSVGSSSPTKVTYQHKLGIGDELYQALTNYIKEYFNHDYLYDSKKTIVPQGVTGTVVAKGSIYEIN